MNKHTPAPWGLFDGKSSSLNGRQIVLAVKDNHGFEVVDLETGKRSPDFALNGETVAVVYEDTEKFQDWTPNARLIASAPELLEALIALLGDVEFAQPKIEAGLIGNRQIKKARAAITKATGGTS
jgi:hypothetical protein